MLTVRAGALNKRVTLENPSAPVSDNDGGFTTLWPPSGGTTLAKVWASVQPATARDLERVVAGTVQSNASHLVTVRYIPGVTTKTRVIFHDTVGDRTFSVTGIHDPDERHISLVLACQEVVT